MSGPGNISPAADGVSRSGAAAFSAELLSDDVCRDPEIVAPELSNPGRAASELAQLERGQGSEGVAIGDRDALRTRATALAHRLENSKVSRTVPINNPEAFQTILAEEPAVVALAIHRIQNDAKAAAVLVHVKALRPDLYGEIARQIDLLAPPGGKGKRARIEGFIGCIHAISSSAAPTEEANIKAAVLEVIAAKGIRSRFDESMRKMLGEYPSKGIRVVGVITESKERSAAASIIIARDDEGSTAGPQIAFREELGASSEPEEESSFEEPRIASLEEISAFIGGNIGYGMMQRFSGFDAADIPVDIVPLLTSFKKLVQQYEPSEEKFEELRKALEL